MFHNIIHCGYKDGSGASGSKKLLLNKSLIEDAVPAPVGSVTGLASVEV